MVKRSFYFYLSGFISLGLFSLVLSTFFYMIFLNKKLNSYALKKENYISISIVIPKIVQSTRSMDKQEKKRTKIVEEKQVKNINVEDLFNNVWTKDIVKEKQKKENTKRLLEIQKKIKTAELNKVESLKKKISAKNNKKSDKDAKLSTANEVNEYLAKINALVYQHFTPPLNSQGHSVKAVIELSVIGKVVNFRILNYSANEFLNKECEKIKERLKSVIFPINPQNKPSRTIVILTSKE